MARRQPRKSLVREIEERLKEVLGDAQTTAAVHSALYTDVPVAGLQVRVSTEHGIVYLEGEVASERQKHEVGRIARAVSPDGVRRVINRIQVNPYLRPIPPT